MQSLLQDIASEDDDVEILESQLDDINDNAMSNMIDEAPVVKLINAILTNAVTKGASDIHFECFEARIARALPY